MLASDSAPASVVPADQASILFGEAESLRNGVGGQGVDLRGALAKYEEASRLGGTAGAAALCALAQLHEQGVANILPRNLFIAAELYNASAAAGNATAQFTMGVFHSYGLFGASKSDLLANLYYYMSSMGGYGPASTALGYRHAQGITVPKSCSAAVQYYRAASGVAVDQYLARGNVLPSSRRIFLNDDTLETLGDDENLQEHHAEYYKNMADNGGDPSVLNLLGHLYFYGARGLKQDFAAAADMFKLAEERGAASHASLGHLYLHGLGVPKDVELARAYFSTGVAADEPASLNALGLMLLNGVGTSQDVMKGAEYIKRAVDKGHTEAYFNLAMLKLRGVGTERDFRGALQLLTVAQNQGHVMASYVLADMNMNGIGGPGSCPQALALFRSVALRGEWLAWHSRALDNIAARDATAALLDFLRLSELGYPEGQVNAAYLLEEVFIPEVKRLHPPAAKKTSLFSAALSGSDSSSATKPPLPSSPVTQGGHGVDRHDSTESAHASPMSASTGADAHSATTSWTHVEAIERLMFKLYSMSSTVDARSLLKLGDFHYYGMAGLEASPPKAATLYRRAATEGRMAQAAFNLGYMHEFGVGLPQDLHLAKRYYDEALLASPKAYYAVIPCLWRVIAKLWWVQTPRGSVSSSASMESELPSAFWASRAALSDKLHDVLAACAGTLGVPVETFCVALVASMWLGVVYVRAVRRAKARSLFYRRLLLEARARAPRPQ